LSRQTKVLESNTLAKTGEGEIPPGNRYFAPAFAFPVPPKIRVNPKNYLSTSKQKPYPTAGSYPQTPILDIEKEKESPLTKQLLKNQTKSHKAKRMNTLPIKYLESGLWRKPTN
jgi:hypothetical protein